LVCPADLQTALQTKLTVDWRAGVAATDWDTIAKKEHLDQLSVEMRKVEGQIREIYAEMLQLQQREQEMRDLNGEWLAPFWSLPARMGSRAPSGRRHTYAAGKVAELWRPGWRPW
jgi:hypothetical protein